MVTLAAALRSVGSRVLNNSQTLNVAKTLESVRSITSNDTTVTYNLGKHSLGVSVNLDAVNASDGRDVGNVLIAALALLLLKLDGDATDWATLKRSEQLKHKVGK